MSCTSCNRDWQRGAVGLVKNILHIDQASDSVQAARLNHCRDCGELVRFQAALAQTKADVGLLDTCALCTCPVRQKVKLQGEKCPKGLWSDETAT